MVVWIYFLYIIFSKSLVIIRLYTNDFLREFFFLMKACGELPSPVHAWTGTTDAIRRGSQLMGMVSTTERCC